MDWSKVEQLHIQAQVSEDAGLPEVRRWCELCAGKLRSYVKRRGGRLFSRVPMPPPGPMEFVIKRYTPDNIRLLATFVVPINPEYRPHYAVRADVLVTKSKSR